MRERTGFGFEPLHSGGTWARNKKRAGGGSATGTSGEHDLGRRPRKQLEPVDNWQFRASHQGWVQSS
jgi:hypothetical protein